MPSRSLFRTSIAGLVLLAGATASFTAPTGALAAKSRAAAPDPKVRPSIDAITCRSACQAIDAGVAGSVVQISGSNVGAAVQAVLLGKRGRKDDKVVPALPVSASAVLVTVPAGTRTGPVRVITSAKLESTKSSRRLLVGRKGDAPRRGALIQSRADVRRVTGGVIPSVSFFNRSGDPLDIAVDVLRSGAVVAHFDVPHMAGRSVASVAWSGADGQAEGRYEWRVWTKAESERMAASQPSVSGGGASPEVTSASAKRVVGPTFSIVRHVFPIQGKHSYGEGAGRFGAGRNGHSHQGQDVFASCGTPLVAVTGGEIKYNGYDGNGGNYIVLAADDGNDYAYMHLRERSPAAKGAKVNAGQFVGNVGDTGDAVGCHLHFEIWPAPGWYTGGSPIDPLPALKSWDS